MTEDQVIAECERRYKDGGPENYKIDKDGMFSPPVGTAKWLIYCEPDGNHLCIRKLKNQASDWMAFRSNNRTEETMAIYVSGRI